MVQEFDKVTIIPFAQFGDLSARSVPKGVVYCKPLISKRTRYNIRGLIGRETSGYFFKDFFASRVFLNRKRMHAWAVEYIHTNLLLRHPFVKQIEKDIRPEDVVYSYWGIDACNLSLFWKGKAKFVSRFHGSYDLWEAARGNYAPLRSFVASELNLAAPISQSGYNFLTTKYPAFKAQVFRLGVFDNGCSNRSDDGVLRVLSCAYISPLKRIPLVFKSLEAIKDIRIEWTHIGDGVDRVTVEDLVATNSNPNLTVRLLGGLPHEKVIDYYRNNSVDAFISLSAIEGIPVSIMEAISFNVPVIGTDVGGTKEIVTEETGVLVSSNPSLEEVSGAIHTIKERLFHPRKFWMKFYNAAINYSSFARMITKL